MGTVIFSIFSCFLETWTEINAHTIIDSASPRLRKIGISLVADSEDDICDQNGKPSTSSHLIPSTPSSPQQSQTLTQLTPRLWHLLLGKCVLSQPVPPIESTFISLSAS